MNKKLQTINLPDLLYNLPYNPPCISLADDAERLYRMTFPETRSFVGFYGKEKTEVSGFGKKPQRSSIDPKEKEARMREMMGLIWGKPEITADERREVVEKHWSRPEEELTKQQKQEAMLEALVRKIGEMSAEQKLKLYDLC